MDRTTYAGVTRASYQKTKLREPKPRLSARRLALRSAHVKNLLAHLSSLRTRLQKIMPGVAKLLNNSLKLRLKEKPKMKEKPS